MKTVVISPYSKSMLNNEENPKNYPYWDEVVKGLKEHNIKIIQIGLNGELPIGADILIWDKSIKDLKELLLKTNTFISVDNFFPHLAELIGKRGVVIFSQSDPEIFGYKENINLLKDRSYLRPLQFDSWSNAKFNKEAFVSPQEVISAVMSILGE